MFFQFLEQSEHILLTGSPQFRRHARTAFQQQGFGRQEIRGIISRILALPGQADQKAAPVDKEVRDLYGASLVLIRPDQIVAWRGESDANAASVLAFVSGRSLPCDGSGD